MKNMIKKIRTELDISQEEFAEKLNVSFATINRWENGRAFPNNLAQQNIFNLCMEKKVSVYDIVLERIDEEVKNISIEEGRKLLYHGSKAGIKGKIEPKSRSQCDFGRGFYMDTEAVQALSLICDLKDSAFYVVSVDESKLSSFEVPEGREWALLVAYNRGKMESISGTDFYNKYRDMASDKDLVIGNIANDRMFFVIDNFFRGNITDVAMVNSLSVLNRGKQYAAVSQKGCDAVRIEKEITISHLERLAIREAATENRKNGVSLANEICKNFRREGLFFDEVLEKAKGGDK